jgi:hypothetical protein
MKNSNRNVILINNLFNGRYIFDENLGHEVINIYKSDNDKFYIYVNPYGNIDKKWDNQIRYILLGRTVSNTKMFKIIAKCEVEKQILIDTKYGVLKKHEEQLKYIEDNKISYGGVPVNKIFANNKDSNGFPYFITFEVKNVMRAIQDIKLSPLGSNNKDSIIMAGIKRINNQSQKLYIQSKDITNYKKLIAVINNFKLWQPINDKIDIDRHNKNNSRSSFLSIIKKEYDEITISNLLAYFLKKDNQLWSNFCEKVLNIEEIKNNTPLIKRESEGNIDLFIEVGNHLIIIENKIKSQINAKRDNGYSQLKKYIDHSYKYAKNHNIPKDNIHFYLIRPNYNNEDFSKFNKDDKKYIEIKYSSIWKIIKERNDGDYFNEFKYVIKKHSSEFDNELFDKLKERFIKQILLNKDRKV